MQKIVYMVDMHQTKNTLFIRDFKPKGLIKSLKLTTEMVSLDEEEKQMLLSKKIDYIITQVQESKEIIPVNSTVDI